jgi:hypothetical protein
MKFGYFLDYLLKIYVRLHVLNNMFPACFEYIL